MKNFVFGCSLLIGLVLVGCGGGSLPDPENNDSNGTQDTQVPLVTSIAPANGAIGVDRGVNITAVFDEAMEGSTVTSGSFILKSSNGAAVGANVSYDDTGNEATLDPTVKLGMMEKYTATLSSSIKDLAGNALAAKSWSFTTEDGEWGSAAKKRGPLSHIYQPVIRENLSGDAVLIWEELEGGTWYVSARIYNVATKTWHDVVQLGANPLDIDAAICPGGDAVAVWSDQSTSPLTVKLRSYSHSSNSWGSVQTLSGAGATPSAACGKDGNILVVWGDTSDNHIYSARYNSSTGSWVAGGRVDTLTNNAWSPLVAMDSNGNAQAIWAQDDGSGNQLLLSRNYTSGSWTGIPQTVVSSAHGFGYHKLAVDINGNSVVAWSEDNPVPSGGWEIYARYHQAGTSGWKTAVKLTSNGNAKNIQAAMDGDGNAILVWQEKPNSGTNYGIYSSYYNVAESAWSSAKNIQSSGVTKLSVGFSPGDAVYPHVAMSSNGSAMAVWTKVDTSHEHHVVSNHFIPDVGWVGAKDMDTVNSCQSVYLDVAMDAKGNAKAAWIDYDSSALSELYISNFE